MAIIDQVDYTKFRKLRFDSTSNQPYIQKPIPSGKSSYNRWGDTDVFLRGGSLTTSRIVDDVSRITQMFFDFKSPNGILFTTKQNVLSAMEVNTKVPLPETLSDLNRKVYTPLNTIAQVALTPLGQHVTKQGLIPTSPVIDDGLSSWKSWFQRQLPGRLEILYQDKILSKTVGNTLYSYVGGPNSFGILGKTTIKLASPENRTGINNINLLTDFDVNGNFNYKNYRKDYLNSNRDPKVTILRKDDTLRSPIRFDYVKLLKPGSDGLSDVKRTIMEDFNNEGKIVNNLSSNLSYPSLLDYQTIIDYPNINKLSNKTRVDFRTKLATQYQVASMDYTKSEQTYPGRVNFSDSYAIDKHKNSPDKDKPLNYTDAKWSKIDNAYDKINALVVYQSTGPKPSLGTNDLVKFRIAIIDNNNPNLKNYIHFRAYIDSFSDSYSSEWDSFKYVGRGENMYRYKGFNREVNMSWTVMAQSKAEVFPMYHKLNYLASSLAPDYSDNGYMRGNLAVLTVGGYLHEQPGIITSITYDVPQEATWEIAIGTQNGPITNSDVGDFEQDSSMKEVPHMIKVTGFKFIPIHEFTPQIQKMRFDKETKKVNHMYGQRYIALKAAGNMYNSFNNGVI